MWAATTTHEERLRKRTPRVLGPHCHEAHESAARRCNRSLARGVRVRMLRFPHALLLGRLRLDEPVGKYLPWLHGALAELTARQLLTHTSGLWRGEGGDCPPDLKTYF